MSTTARSLEPWRWIGIPMLQVLAISILFAIPMRFWGVGLPEPLFALPVIFAWAVIRASMIAPVGVMILGLALDFLWGAPTGFWAVCLLIAYGAALVGRTMLAGQGRAVYWAWYAVIVTLALAAAWMLTLLQTGGAANFGAVAWQFLWTVILYPLADRLIERFEDADVRFR